MVTAYIGFGSNLGDLYANCRRAQSCLAAIAGVTCTRVSPLYHSEPLTRDGDEQPWYLNGVFEIETGLVPFELLAALKAIEKLMGRGRRKKWAPRVVDLDILFYGDAIYQDANVRVPHGGIPNRRFVLAPLCDLNPEFVHPEFGLTMRELLVASNDPLRVEPFAPPKREAS